MKLFKKVLAMALASALALTLLVGCGGDGKSTFTIVDYLNDSAAMEGDDTTYKADTALDTNAKNVVTILQGLNAKSINELGQKLYNDKDAQKAVANAASGQDTKNVYEIGYVLTGQNYVTDAAKDFSSIYDAGSLSSSRELVSAPASAVKLRDANYPEDGYVIDESKVESTTYVGTATMSLGGKSYLVAVFRTAVKA